jgi:hypothetical protein
MAEESFSRKSDEKPSEPEVDHSTLPEVIEPNEKIILNPVIHDGKEVVPGTAPEVANLEVHQLEAVTPKSSRICGLRRRSFMIVCIVALVVVIAAAVGGGVGGSLANKSSSDESPYVDD